MTLQGELIFVAHFRVQGDACELTVVATAEKLRGHGICRAVLNQWFDPVLHQVRNSAALQVARPVCTCLYLRVARAGSCNKVTHVRAI